MSKGHSVVNPKPTSGAKPKPAGLVDHKKHGLLYRTDRLNELSRKWRETIVNSDWVFVDFTAPATAYIHALEAECERVGIVIDRTIG